MPKDSGDTACLIDHAKRRIGFDQAVQRFRYVGRGLIVIDDGPEAVYRGEIMLPVQVETPDFHLFSCQMIAGQVDFQLCVPGVFGFGKSPDDLGQRRQGLFGN